MLLDFKAKNWETINPDVKYRVIANLANNYFELHEKYKAAETILELEDIKIHIARIQ